MFLNELVRAGWSSAPVSGIETRYRTNFYLRFLTGFQNLGVYVLHTKKHGEIMTWSGSPRAYLVQNGCDGDPRSQKWTYRSQSTQLVAFSRYISLRRKLACWNWRLLCTRSPRHLTDPIHCVSRFLAIPFLISMKNISHPHLRWISSTLIFTWSGVLWGLQMCRLGTAIPRSRLYWWDRQFLKTE